MPIFMGYVYCGTIFFGVPDGEKTFNRPEVTAKTLFALMIGDQVHHLFHVTGMTWKGQIYVLVWCIMFFSMVFSLSKIIVQFTFFQILPPLAPTDEHKAAEAGEAKDLYLTWNVISEGDKENEYEKEKGKEKEIEKEKENGKKSANGVESNPNLLLSRMPSFIITPAITPKNEDEYGYQPDHEYYSMDKEINSDIESYNSGLYDKLKIGGGGNTSTRKLLFPTHEEKEEQKKENADDDDVDNKSDSDVERGTNQVQIIKHMLSNVPLRALKDIIDVGVTRPLVDCPLSSDKLEKLKKRISQQINHDIIELENNIENYFTELANLLHPVPEYDIE